MKYTEPQRELGSLKKVTRKTIATQTIDLAKVLFTFLNDFNFFIWFLKHKASIFKKLDYEDKNNFEPLFENTKSAKKGKNVSHFTSMERVTNKVF